MSARRRLGAVLVVVGLLVTGVGVAGALSTVGGPATAAASGAPNASSGASASAAPSSTATPAPTPSPTPTPTPSPTPDPDTLAKAFFVDLVQAIRAGDVDSMLPRLHPAVIERYGEAACKQELETRSADPAYEIVVKVVQPPAAWDYTLDGVTTSIPDAWTVDADVTALGQLGARQLHVAPVDGEVRWFTDCGTPLP
jgi:hypothetical protein